MRNRLLLALLSALALGLTGAAPSDAGVAPAPVDVVAPAPPDAKGPAPVAPAPGASGGNAALDRLIDGVNAYYERVEHMKTRFRQVVRQKTLTRTRKAQGTLEFLKPGRMRWEYERPERVLYVSDGETLWSYQEEDALVYRARIKGSRFYQALRFLFGMGDLRETFHITMGPAHSPETAFLVLLPKSGGQDFKELALVVDRGTFEIRESFLTDPLDNVTHYIFEDPDYESPVAEERFRFTPPPGVTVRDL